MDVKFITTTAAGLDSVQPVDGQIIAVSDKPGYYYDMGGTRKSVGGISVVSELPAKGVDGALYVVINGDAAECFIYEDGQFISAGGGKAPYIALTSAEYENLSEDAKMQDVLYILMD